MKRICKNETRPGRGMSISSVFSFLKFSWYSNNGYIIESLLRLNFIRFPYREIVYNFPVWHWFRKKYGCTYVSTPLGFSKPWNQNLPSIKELFLFTWYQGQCWFIFLNYITHIAPGHKQIMRNYSCRYFIL